MADYAFERLSAQDATFLWAEKPNHPMHVGALALFESGALLREDGSIDIDGYRKLVESVLHWIPRYRQKLAWTPLEGWPVWVDDRQFAIDYHIRHIALPKPGTREQLKELAGRINERPLDRSHPLWEIWVIEGVEGGEHFALLNKIHHCMIDGAAGVDLAQILFSPSPKATVAESLPYMPRPAPSRGELLRDSLAVHARRPFSLWKGALEAAGDLFGARDDQADEPAEPLRELERRAKAVGAMAKTALGPPSATPLNGPLGPHRRFEWRTMPLADVKELRRELDCTVNDIVLATVTEAVRRYLFRRRVDHRTIDFRVSAPVSMRRPEHDRRQGNHVSSWVVPLPLALEDPIEQLEAIAERTRALKDSEAALGVEMAMELAEWLPAPVLKAGLQAVGGSGPVNMIVTNVPGPQFPLYMMGAKLLAMYPIVPLLPGGGLGVALFSYEGKLCWGFNGDSELVPDLATLAEEVQVAFERLRSAVVSRYMHRRTAQVEAATPSATHNAGPSGQAVKSLPVAEVAELEDDAPVRIAAAMPMAEGVAEEAAKGDRDAETESEEESWVVGIEEAAEPALRNEA